MCYSSVNHDHAPAHVWMERAVVAVRPFVVEGVRVRLAVVELSAAQRSAVIGGHRVRGIVLIRPSDGRAPADDQRGGGVVEVLDLHVHGPRDG